MSSLAFLTLAASLLLSADPYTSIGFLKFPAEVEVGAMSGVAIGPGDRVYALHRGEPPLVAFDADGKFIRAWGQGLFKVPHGLRVASRRGRAELALEGRDLRRDDVRCGKEVRHESR